MNSSVKKYAMVRLLCMAGMFAIIYGPRAIWGSDPEGAQKALEEKIKAKPIEIKDGNPLASYMFYNNKFTALTCEGDTIRGKVGQSFFRHKSPIISID